MKVAELGENRHGRLSARRGHTELIFVSLAQGWDMYLNTMGVEFMRIIKNHVTLKACTKRTSYTL